MYMYVVIAQTVRFLEIKNCKPNKKNIFRVLDQMDWNGSIIEKN